MHDHLNPSRALKCKTDWMVLIGINTVIAIFLTLVSQSSFWINLIYAQCIGISIASLCVVMVLHKGEAAPSPLKFVMPIIGGVAIGITLASLLTSGWTSANHGDVKILLYSFIYSVLIGVVVVYFFYSRGKQQYLNNQLVQEKLKQSETERNLAQTHLKMLQAQIEPHFLFNTLSNILSLIDRRPEDAKLMLSSLTDYLRGSLHRTRDHATTVGEELDLVSAYLAIQKIRMGERLNYQLHCDTSLREHTLPPLIIQPLVENALRHGLESEIDGGEVIVEISASEHQLTLKVIDSGKGLEENSRAGVGQSNVQSRLQSLYGDQAIFKFIDNQPKGLIVEIGIPK